MKSTSNIEPDNITPDWGSLESGRMDILIHWDITETDDMWEYQEGRIQVDVPTTDHDGIQAYITENTDRYFRMVGLLSPSDIQRNNDMELALLDLAGV
jgi:hypothetical protein